MKLDSDFTDFYDEALFDVVSEKTFVRRKDKSMGRRLALSKLKEFNVNTISCDLGTNTGYWDTEKVIVYMKSNTHNISDKILVSKEDAMIYYPNKICVPFIPDDVTKNITYKTVVIGRRFFNITFKCSVGSLLYEGEVADIIESNTKFNTKLVDNSGREYGPIYSIDYIRNYDGNLVAIDFNEVQSLGMFNRTLSSKGIIDEIKWYYDII